MCRSRSNRIKEKNIMRIILQSIHHLLVGKSMFWMHDPHQVDRSCISVSRRYFGCLRVLVVSLCIDGVNFPFVYFLSELNLIDIKIPCYSLLLHQRCCCCYFFIRKKKSHKICIFFSFKCTKNKITECETTLCSPHPLSLNLTHLQ